MLIQDAQLQLILDLVGVFVFALSGGLVAVKKRLDLFGVLVLAGAAALGGGVFRDVLIGVVPPVGLSDWRLIAAACIAGVVTFMFHPGVERISASWMPPAWPSSPSPARSRRSGSVPAR